MAQLLIKETGLTASTYRFSRGVWADFGFGDVSDQWSTRTNLCKLIRSIFILMPFVYAVNLLVILLAGWMLWTLCYLLWLNLSVTAWIFGIFFAVVVFFAFVFLANRYGKQAVKALERSETGHAIATYYRAKKEKICPLVEMTL